MDYTGKEPISDVLKFRLGQYDYIGTTTGDGSAFYAGYWNHPNFIQAYIFKDWESPNTWLGTVIYAFSYCANCRTLIRDFRVIIFFNVVKLSIIIIIKTHHLQ